MTIKSQVPMTSDPSHSRNTSLLFHPQQREETAESIPFAFILWGCMCTAYLSHTPACTMGNGEPGEAAMTPITILSTVADHTHTHCHGNNIPWRRLSAGSSIQSQSQKWFKMVSGAQHKVKGVDLAYRSRVPLEAPLCYSQDSSPVLISICLFVEIQTIFGSFKDRVCYILW